MRVRIALLPVIAAAALLAGCASGGTTTPAATTAPAGNGVEALSADEIMTKAKAALEKADKFQVKGEMTDEGTKAKVDFVFAGDDLSSTFEGDGMSIAAIKVGSDLYVKLPQELLAALAGEENAAAVALLQGKWLKAPAGDPRLSEFAEAMDINEILKAEGTLTKGEVSTVNGTKVIAIKDGDKGTFYIATEGEPLPIRMEGPAGEGTLDFTYTGVPEIKAPAATEFIDVSQFMK